MAEIVPNVKKSKRMDMDDISKILNDNETKRNSVHLLLQIGDNWAKTCRAYRGADFVIFFRERAPSL